jgi:hypothetical protein
MGLYPVAVILLKKNKSLIRPKYRIFLILIHVPGILVVYVAGVIVFHGCLRCTFSLFYTVMATFQRYTFFFNLRRLLNTSQSKQRHTKATVSKLSAIPAAF